MINKLSFRRAYFLGLLFFSTLFFFHLVTVLGILLFDFDPLTMLWGGKIKTAEQLLYFEITSMFVSSLGVLIFLIRGNKRIDPKLISFSRFFLWVFFALFVLNTIGNVLAESVIEKLFSVLTMILAVICCRIAIEPIHLKENS